MRRALHQGSILIVEGPLDSRVYRQFTHSTCRVVIAEGKANATEVIRRLRPGFAGLAAIVDQDFASLDMTTPRSDDIMLSDGRDIECMLFASPAFDRVVAAMADSDRLDRLQDATGASLRTLVYRSAAPVGALRHISHADGLDFKFKGIEFSKFIHAADLEASYEELILEVGRKTIRPGLDPAVYAPQMRQLVENAEPEALVNGHDLTSVLSQALRRTIASHNAGDVSTDRLALSVGYAFDRSDWERTLLATRLREWEERNPGYRLVRT